MQCKYALPKLSRKCSRMKSSKCFHQPEESGGDFLKFSGVIAPHNFLNHTFLAQSVSFSRQNLSFGSEQMQNMSQQPVGS